MKWIQIFGLIQNEEVLAATDRTYPHDPELEFSQKSNESIKNEERNCDKYSKTKFTKNIDQ